MAKLEHYEVKWHYKVNDIWFEGTSGTTEETNHTYSYPSNAIEVKVTVSPISKTYKEGDVEKTYWTAEKTTTSIKMEVLPPDALSAPEVSIEKYSLTAKIENITDAKVEEVWFEVYKDDDVKPCATGKATVRTARASFTCAVQAGSKYRVRCKGVNIVGNSNIEGEWSLYSGEVDTIPSAPTNVKVSVESDKSVKVMWDACSSAKSYTVQYATNKLYFDSSSDVQSTTVENTYAIISGIETGHEWYFRVKATNDKGDSGYSDLVYKVVGTKPEPPTTWSLTSTAIIGDPVVLYWVHNSEDGSKQNQAQIELTINGTGEIVTVNTSEDILDPDEIDKIYTYNVDLTAYPQGAEILWRVRTRGVLAEYSDWSIQRSINTYAPPTMMLTLGDNSGDLTQYPFNIAASVGPAVQTALSYHVSITSLFTYWTQDRTGKDILVNAGDEVYSKVFLSPGNEFSYDLLPQDLTLENNQSYNINVVAAMDSGLTAESTGVVTVSWSETNYQPDASVAIDKNTLCAYISPYCMDGDELIDDVVLSVYRREYDGTFTEIATDIINAGSTSVTDPHPSLDYARYRVVARSTNTNVIGFTDLAAIPVNEPSIVIQWNESWSNFDIDEEAGPEIPFATGSTLKLKYNVDVQESNMLDKTLVNYIGRKSPVSYYGTQQGVTGSWSTDIPKYDKETIYALRRLAVWGGDVYVREPNGMGYNASIEVSMNIKHKELTIPVSIEVTRVEGDI